MTSDPADPVPSWSIGSLGHARIRAGRELPRYVAAEAAFADLTIQRSAMDRRVTAIKKARDGRIVALCNPGESWSPRKMADVIGDINSNKQSYYVQQLERRTYVRVVDGALRTTTDTTSRNHLDALPTS